MAIDTKLIKELRDRTAAGMMDCKNALEATSGDIEAAIEWLREKGIAKAVKKAGRIAAEGLTTVYAKGNEAVILELNSETDFVAQNEQFKQLVQTIAEFLVTEKPETLEIALSSTLNGKELNIVIAEAAAVIGEKLDLRRFQLLTKTDSQVFGPYIHMGGKVSVLSLLEGANETVARDISMQVAALNPQFISRDQIDQAFIAKEKAMIVQQTIDEGKPEAMVEKIAEGRLAKQLKEICLVDQPFVKDESVSVGKFVQNNGGSIITVVRYAVGEGIEKKVDNFAEEVMSQVRGQ